MHFLPFFSLACVHQLMKFVSVTAETRFTIISRCLDVNKSISKSAFSPSVL